MNISELADAIAYLSEEITALRSEQKEHNQVIGENLRQWSQINAALMECLDRQSEEYQGSASILQVLAEHLLTLAHTTQQLTASTAGLGVSSEKLTMYLEEKQSPQLIQLGENNKQLQASSEKLEEYLIKEQSKRLSLLENGLKSLLEMIQVSQERSQSLIAFANQKEDKAIPLPYHPTQSQVPPLPQSQVPPLTQSKRSFDIPSLLSSAVLYSGTTAFLLLSLWQFGGIGAELARISERSEWNLIKLERIESELGIR